jgi:hypothetical protein
MAECAPQGVYALSTIPTGLTAKGKERQKEKGDTHISAATLSDWATEAGAGIPGFRTKRIRSGVETLLASARVSSDTRGRLQSHGISGVQARHYDGHDYMDEKREALTKLHKLLDAPHNTMAKVVPIKAA